MSDHRSPTYESVGACILAWARVEIQLHMLFLHLCGTSSDRSTQLWDRIRSFEAKMQSLQDVATVVISEEAELRDWRLIQGYVLSMYRLRNKIAHGALLQQSGDVFIEPFFSITGKSGERLRVPDINSFTNQFAELREIIQWFQFRRMNKETQHQQWPEQEPDQMRRLRLSDDQKREAQRHRALAWNQYLERNPNLKKG